jgi:transcriptional regulator with XRE-family HTH domain
MVSHMATERIRPVLGRNGRNARGKRPQEQIAAGVGQGWTKSTVSSIENGRRALSIAELVLYARALGVSVGALLADHDNPGVPLVGDLTAAQVQLILTGEVLEPPDQVNEGVATMRAAGLDRLVADRLGITVTEVREHAKRHYDGRTLHAERERRASAYATRDREYARTLQQRCEEAAKAYDDLITSATPEERDTIDFQIRRDTLRENWIHAEDAARRATLQAERADSPQMRGAITKTLVDEMSEYVAAVTRQQQRSDA